MVRGRGLLVDALAQGALHEVAGVRVRVDGARRVAAEFGEGQAHAHGGGGLADAALEAEHGGVVAALQLAGDAAGQLVLLALPARWGPGSRPPPVTRYREPRKPPLGAGLLLADERRRQRGGVRRRQLPVRGQIPERTTPVLPPACGPARAGASGVESASAAAAASAQEELRTGSTGTELVLGVTASKDPVQSSESLPSRRRARRRRSPGCSVSVSASAIWLSAGLGMFGPPGLTAISRCASRLDRFKQQF